MKRPIVLPRKKFVNQFPLANFAFTFPLSNETSKVLSLTVIFPLTGASPFRPRKWSLNETSAMWFTVMGILILLGPTGPLRCV